ncbi:uncharacterized protein LOC135226058 [Macrobrachium nipponense]|uniref:uncharacterized protein LOC135226058 n=1 Tax=Macrobrachium nipponense TaxID=159736 RepID=UPI0030C828C7
MTKLLQLLLTLVISASARSADQIKMSNENKTVTFDLPTKSSTYLGYLADEEDASFTFEVEGFDLERGKEKSATKSHQSFEAKIWHLMQIWITTKENEKSTVLIYPNTTYHISGDEQPRNIKINSNKRVYWTQCNNYHSCYFSGSVLNAPDFRGDSSMSSTTLILIIVCGLQGVAVIGLVTLVVVLLIRGKKKTMPQEPEANVTEEAVYEEVSLSGTLGNFHRGAQEDHESINSLYGYTTQRGG